ncbi:MAG TPA: 50S ribosomal protein L39e [Candidatus Norongarragalinales archaeon]|jgi:large subunit ribosomal protein L39e|nr:50S ribosomal protein L39e [Candidatus Norongarragalinales archaeon]
MGKAKSKEKKIALAKRLRQNRRIPIFVIAKTKRKVSMNPKRRNWRTAKLKLKVE